MIIAIAITALMLAVSLTACVKPCKNNNIINYDYIER